MWHMSGTPVTTRGFYRSSCRCSVQIAFAVAAPFGACPRCRESIGWKFAGAYPDPELAGCEHAGLEDVRVAVSA
jgi:hypothetical protein